MRHKSSFSQSYSTKSKDLCKRADTLVKLSQTYERTKPKHSFRIAYSAYSIAQKLDYEPGIAASLCMMGKSSWVLGEFEEAISYLMESLEISKRTGVTQVETDALKALGNICYDSGDFDKALEYYMGSLRIAEENGDRLRKANILNNIGEIYRNLGAYDDALNYYLSSKQIHEDIGTALERAVPILNIGITYFDLNDFEKAKEFNLLSLKVAKEIGDRLTESYSYYQLAQTHQSLMEYELAKQYYFKSLQIAEETGDRVNHVHMLICIGNLYDNLNDYDEALECFSKAYKISCELKINTLISKACSCLAAINEKMERLDTAIYYYKELHKSETMETANKLEQNLKSIKTMFKMEQVQKEKEIYQLKNVELKHKTEELERKTDELKALYDDIKVISEIGRSITSTLDLNMVLDRVYESINSLMDATVFGIGIYCRDTDSIDYKLFIEEKKRVLASGTTFPDQNSLASWCVTNMKEILINDLDNEYENYIERPVQFGLRMESIIYCPLIAQNSVIGVITVQSKNKGAYTQYNMDTIKTLGSYIAIAVKNAQESELLAKEIEIRKRIQRELEQANEKLSNLSRIDELTKIANRRKFEEVLRAEWHRAKRERLPLSLIFIDIDYFKQYNDSFGHLAGDECIKRVAKILSTTAMRASDFVARYGGDEFVAVLPNTVLRGAIKLAERMRERIEEMKIDQYSGCVTVTLGIVSTVPGEESSLEEFVKAADAALYRAKGKGRNRIEASKMG